MAQSLDVLVHICANANHKGVLHVNKTAWMDIVEYDAAFHALPRFEDIKSEFQFCGMPIIADESVVYAEVKRT